MIKLGGYMELHFLKTTWSDIIFLKQGNDVAMIDTGFEEQFKDIKEYLDKLGIQKISFILLTHFHKDHYGSISNLVKNYHVEKVYFKEYSVLDKTTSKGTPADDQYRLDEYRKWLKIKKDIEENSTLISVENIEKIQFGKYTLELFHTSNSMREIYDDSNNSASYHKILFNENQNSLAVFLQVNGVNIFLGGDIQDIESIHSKATYVNYQIASKINEEIDIYKVPHHGTIQCNSEKALEIYKPKIAIITNGREYLETESTIFQDLKKANPNVQILLTEHHSIIFNITETGTISYQMDESE